MCLGVSPPQHTMPLPSAGMGGLGDFNGAVSSRGVHVAAASAIPLQKAVLQIDMSERYATVVFDLPSLGTISRRLPAAAPEHQHRLPPPIAAATSAFPAAWAPSGGGGVRLFSRASSPPLGPVPLPPLPARTDSRTEIRFLNVDGSVAGPISSGPIDTGVTAESADFTQFLTAVYAMPMVRQALHRPGTRRGDRHANTYDAFRRRWFAGRRTEAKVCVCDALHCMCTLACSCSSCVWSLQAKKAMEALQANLGDVGNCDVLLGEPITASSCRAPVFRPAPPVRAALVAHAICCRHRCNLGDRQRSGDAARQFGL